MSFIENFAPMFLKSLDLPRLAASPDGQRALDLLRKLSDDFAAIRKHVETASARLDVIEGRLIKENANG